MTEEVKKPKAKAKAKPKSDGLTVVYKNSAGTKIEVNNTPENIAAAEAAGWKK